MDRPSGYEPENGSSTLSVGAIYEVFMTDISEETLELAKKYKVPTDRYTEVSIEATSSVSEMKAFLSQFRDEDFLESFPDYGGCYYDGDTPSFRIGKSVLVSRPERDIKRDINKRIQQEKEQELENKLKAMSKAERAAYKVAQLEKKLAREKRKLGKE